MKNVARTYSLEHKGESHLFYHVFDLLISHVKNEDLIQRELALRIAATKQSFSQHMPKEEKLVFVTEDHFRRELASRTGVIKTSLSQHMSKEEEQVFLSHLFIYKLFYQLFLNMLQWLLLMFPILLIS